ncbi:glycosyltransferase family 2 protein [Paenibacillus odorifer]|uniref:Glycosyl transferase family 2 n=1 Tax=Paenibacillus odorifer TaxID=189426 RepID=A0AAD0P6G6_9BACL|nr:glycosyltransferase family 2 protein [Paenibacillus odorifer]AWV36045.1 glycosyl transferase family 2 [Paenibacillus odorifer]
MNVSIVIPNFNGEKFLIDCLTTLKEQSYQDYETILVDNGSTDDSIKLALEIMPEINCLLLDENKGFSAAVNQGILNSKGKYVALLNNDTLLTVKWLENLLACIESDENVFSCSSKMIQFHDNKLIDNAGDAFTVFGWAYQEGHGENINKYLDNRYIFTSCAGAAIYRREVFDKIGYFDEQFFAYLEDVDIGYRARIEGYDNLYCAESIIYHIGSATTGNGYNSVKVKLSARNNVYLLYKNMLGIQLLLNAPFLIVGHLFKYQFYKKIGFQKEYSEGIRQGITNRKNLTKTEFKISNMRNYVSIQYWLIKKGLQYGIVKIKKMLKLKNDI